MGVPGDDLLGHRCAHLLVRHGPGGLLRAGVLVRARLPQGDFLQGKHREGQGEVPPRQRVHHPQPAPSDDRARVVLAAGPGAAATAAAQRRPGRRALSLLAALTLPTFYLAAASSTRDDYFHAQTHMPNERHQLEQTACSHFESVSHIPQWVSRVEKFDFFVRGQIMPFAECASASHRACTVWRILNVGARPFFQGLRWPVEF